MILRIEEIKKVCSKVLWAVDAGDMSDCCGLVRLSTNGSNLYFTVSSNEYSMTTRIDYDGSESFEAVVDANVFLKLISQTTTDTIELTVNDRSLNITANGNYKLPMVYEGDKLIEFKPIELVNKTDDFIMNNEALKKVLVYNTKQLGLSNGGRDIFNYYYLDSHGCITANLGACVTNFELNSNIKLLLSTRIVRLFKLFDDGDARVIVAKDEINDGLIQTKVEFMSNDIDIRAIISCDDTFMDSYPVAKVRDTANTDYDYLAVIKRAQFVETLNRLNLFVSAEKTVNQCVKFVFNSKGVLVSDINSVNEETIYYQNDIADLANYTAYADLKMIKAVLETITSQFISLKFGNGRAFVLDYDDVKSVVPECKCGN